MENYGTKKMGNALEWILHSRLNSAPDVLPQWRPLFFFFPDVRSLEQRNDEVLGEVEEFQGCAFPRLHLMILPCRIAVAVNGPPIV